ncbi:TPA: HNH endonuclease [Vibrio harveyi]|uniref:HNH endonuclease n=1 Tax=Vibrio parahaemolyticus TaxID=670 RepID=UPI0023625EA3|nr:HNH endonuclease [Vibrio parahaemolyticus]HDM8174821.1 HNH endonuclease [Vibrio harveyi]
MRNIRSIKDKLMEDSGGHCVYCGKTLHSKSEAVLDHFFPKSVYPEVALEPSNLVLACRDCNAVKSDKFPLSEDGSALLLNPNNEDFSEHIKQSKNGLLKGSTDRGKITIDVLKLNRASLVEQRLMKVIDPNVVIDGQLSEKEVTSVFEDSLNKVEQLNKIQLPSSIGAENYMSSMLYANVITALETYLCDRFISIVQCNREYFLSFVENFVDFQKEKITLSSIFKEYESMEERTYDAIKSVLYHNLPKVCGIYCSSLSIDFPDYIEVYKAVNVRHDLVHRGGKTKCGKHHPIDKADVDALVKEVRAFYDLLETELAKI